MVKGSIKKYGKKILSIVLAIVMTVGLVNSPVFVQSVKAATTKVYIYIADDVMGGRAPKTNVFGAGGTTGWAERADYSLYRDADGGNWYTTSKYTSLDANNNLYVYNEWDGWIELGSVVVDGNGSMYVVVTSDGVSKVTEDVANNTYGLSGESTTTEPPTEAPTEAPTEVPTDAPSTETTITFISKDSTIQKDDARIYVIEGTIASGSYKDGNNVMTKGTAMTETTDGTWTATVTSDVITFVRVSRASDGNYYWGWDWENTQRGTETVYTATGKGEGYWGEEPEQEPYTFTFIDGTDDLRVGDGVNLKIVIDGENADAFDGIADMTKVSDTEWTFVVPAKAQKIRVERWNSSFEGPFDVNNKNDRYTYWEIDATTRGSNTVYTATGTDSNYDYVGVGQWGIVSSIFGNPLTDTQLWDMTHLKLTDVTDKNTTSGLDLFEVPVTFYNYKSGGGSSWWNQFQNFDNAIMETYYGDGKLRYPLVTGAPDTQDIGGNDQGQRPLTGLVNGWNSSLTSLQALYYVNHNLSYSGVNSTAAGIGSGSAVVQGLVGEFLNKDGKLLSSENNVILPFFDDNFLGTLGTGTNGVVDGTWATKYGSKDNPYSFPFRVTGNETDGFYYEFDSASGTDNIRVENGTVTYDSSEGARVKNGFADYTGFYPFDTNADSGNADALTYGFGARLDIPFTVTPKTEDTTTEPTCNYANKVLEHNRNDRKEMVFTLKPINGEQYIVLNVNTASNVNIDYINVGSTEYSWDNVLLSGAKLQATDGPRTNVYNFIDKGGYIAIPVTGNGETTVTVGYRAYANDISMNVISVEQTTTAIDSAIAELKSVDSSDTIFSFSGDDDLWVYVDGKLVLDMGGAHGQASGNINFTKGTVTVNDKYVMDYTTNAVSASSEATTTDVDWIKFDDPTVTHTMTVFYMERGLYDSNLKIGFNFNPVKMSQENGFTVSNDMQYGSVNAAFRDDIYYIMQEDGFHYTLANATQTDKTLFDNNTLTFPGTGSATEKEKKEDEEIVDSLRNNYIAVSQTEDTRFDTSYSIVDTVTNTEIKGSTEGLVVDDGRNGDGNKPEGSYVWVQNSTVETNNQNPVGVSVNYVNIPKSSNVVIKKEFEGTSTEETNGKTYNFQVAFTTFFGKEGARSVEGAEYTVYDSNDVEVEKRTIGADGYVQLQAGQYAVIAGVPVESTMTVTEVIASEDSQNYRVKKVTLDGTTVVNGAAVDIDDTDAEYVFVNEAIIGRQNSITVTNVVKYDNVNEGLKDKLASIIGNEQFNYDITHNGSSFAEFDLSVGTPTYNYSEEVKDEEVGIRDAQMVLTQGEKTYTSPSGDTKNKYSTTYKVSDINTEIIKDDGTGLTASDGRNGDTLTIQNKTEAQEEDSVGITVDYVNIVLTSSVKIEKQFDGVETQKQTYYFQTKLTKLFGQDVSSSDALANVVYKVYQTNGDTYVKDGVIDGTNSYVQLESGQYAIIEGIPVDSVISVKEIMEDNEIVRFKNAKLDGSNVENGTTAGIDEGYVPYFVFINEAVPGEVILPEKLVYYTEIGKKTNLPLPSDLDVKATPVISKTDRDGWTVKASQGNSANNAIDGNANTHWDTTAVQVADMWYAVDFGTLHSFDTIEIDSTGSPSNLPKGYEIYAIDDISNIDLATVRNGNYEKLASVETTTETGTMTISLGRTEVSRAIIIIQTGSSTANIWSMHELYIYSSNSVRDMDMDRTGWKAMAYAANRTEEAAATYNVNYALDGKILTRWTSFEVAVEKGSGVGDWFGVDFGKAYTYDSIKLELGKSTGDGVAGYEIYALDDATDVALAEDIRAKGTLLATGTKSDANGIITVPSTTSRYVYVIQTGTRGNYWSIHEFYAFNSLVNKYEISDVEITKNAYDANPATIAFATDDYGNTLDITTTHVGVDELQLQLTDTNGALHTVDVIVYNYNVNDHIYVLDYGLPVNLSKGPSGLLGAIDDAGYNYDANTGVTNDEVIKLDSHKDGYTVLGLADSTIGANYDTNLLYQYAATDFADKMLFDQATVALNEARDAIYTPEKFMANVDEFYYAVQVTKDGYGSGNEELDATNATPVMSAKVEVMPANIIYYEDNFASSGTDADGKNGIIFGSNVTTDGTANDDYQSNDNNEQFGHDSSYEKPGANSQGITHIMNNGDFAIFSFKGTGFDIISRTNSTTGILQATVYYADKIEYTKDGKITLKNGFASIAKTILVNTYYENGDLYQIPVITWRNTTNEATEYVIKLSSGGENKTVYIDGIRIYNPITGDADVENQYGQIGESGATKEEAKKLILGEPSDGFTGYYYGDDTLEDYLSGVLGTPKASLINFSNNSMLAGKTVVEAFTQYNAPNSGNYTSIDRTGWTAKASKGDGSAMKALDGNTGSRWESGANQGENAWFAVLFDEARLYNTIVLDMGTSTGDYPEEYAVYAIDKYPADDTELANIMRNQPLTTGSVSAKIATMTIELPKASSSKGVMIVQTKPKSNTNLYWSIHEFYAYNEQKSPIEVSDMVTYATVGPNHELYLDNNYGIGFSVDKQSDTNATLQIGVKEITGTGSVTLQYKKSDGTWGTVAEVNSSTENYYLLSDKLSEMPVNNGVPQVILKAVSDEGAILSMTYLKYNNYEISNLKESIVTDAAQEDLTSAAKFSGEGFNVNKQMLLKGRYTTITFTTSKDVDDVKIFNESTELSAIKTYIETADGYKWTIRVKPNIQIAKANVKVYSYTVNEGGNQ